MVSKASEDLPEPDRPVNTTSWSRGISTSTFLRLCSRAPRIAITRLSGRLRLLSKRLFIRSVGAVDGSVRPRLPPCGLTERSENAANFPVCGKQNHKCRGGEWPTLLSRQLRGRGVRRSALK